MAAAAVKKRGLTAPQVASNRGGGCGGGGGGGGGDGGGGGNSLRESVRGNGEHSGSWRCTMPTLPLPHCLVCAGPLFEF